MSDALNITPANQCKVVETKDYIVMYGNCYQKEDLSTISKIGCNFNNISAGYNTMSLSKIMHITDTNRYGERDSKFGIVKDPYIMNRYYYIINNNYSSVSNTTSYLVSSEEYDGDIVIKGQLSVANIEWYQILDIDETYIYASGTYLSQFGVYVYRINKSTMTVTSTVFSVVNTNRAKCNLLYKDSTYISFIVGGYANSNAWGTFYFVRYNKTNNEIKSKRLNFPSLQAGSSTYTSTSESVSLAHSNIEIEDIYREDNKYYFCYPQHSGAKLATGDGNANNNLMIICYDSTKSFEDANVITFRTDIGIQNPDIKFASYVYGVYRFWIVDNYLYFATYEESNGYTAMIPIQGIYAFKINPGFVLEYVGKSQINSTMQIISMVYNSTKDILLVGYLNSFEICALNKETHMYETLNRNVTSVIEAGFDSMDRLWYMNSKYGVFTENLNDPQEVEIEFEKLYYAYENQNIESYLRFDAYSFTDAVPSGKYTLTLSGNAYFKETISKTLTIMYDKDSVGKTYDIIINGPKRISCSATFEKVW